MASAVNNTKTVTTVTDEVILTLSLEEASFLRVALRRIGGALTSPRQYANSIGSALLTAGIKASDAKATGSIYF